MLLKDHASALGAEAAEGTTGDPAALGSFFVILLPIIMNLLQNAPCAQGKTTSEALRSQQSSDGSFPEATLRQTRHAAHTAAIQNNEDRHDNALGIVMRPREWQNELDRRAKLALNRGAAQSDQDLATCAAEARLIDG